MNPILALDRKVIDQIAAGEVVERPASVVKELVENSLDSGATRIRVALLEGGISRMEVLDDGGGIPREELFLAVSAHATSKLREPADLEAVATLGFRGEALASIGAVARLTLTSRTSDAEEGGLLEVVFGGVGEPRAAASSRGTRVVVEDLFAELPARRKFLKTPPTEARHASAWIDRFALAHPGVGFHLEVDGRKRLEVVPGEDLDARCAAVFGSGVAEAMVSVEEQAEDFHLEARVGPPESARRNAGRVQLFLNGRWVRDARLLAAVREGVKEFVPKGHYPSLYLSLILPPDRVDVNVHPRKTEVRFREERRVFGILVNSLRRGLANSSWATRSVGGLGAWAQGGMNSGAGFPSHPASSSIPSSFTPSAIGDGGADPSQVAAEEFLPLSVDPGGGALVRVANTFLAREVPEGLEIIDQHALHERVNLEELRAEVRRGNVEAQPLLVPCLVELPKDEMAILLEKADLFRPLGVDLEEFGETTLAIRAIPARLTRLDPGSLVRDLLEIATESKEASPESLIEETLCRMACRGAVMAGDRLEMEDLKGLLRRGEGLPQDRTCAHGRPVRVLLTRADLEKAFYRR